MKHRISKGEAIDQAAKAVGVTLTPWQSTMAMMLLDATPDEMLVQRGRRAGYSTMFQVLEVAMQALSGPQGGWLDVENRNVPLPAGSERSDLLAVDGVRKRVAGAKAKAVYESDAYKARGDR